MQVGVLMFFQNFMQRETDHQLVEREIHLASLIEPLGFDIVGAVEHHFFDYAMSPDNMQFLAYMAARTSRIGLLTAAVILPWHDPLRVAERMIFLDHLSNGRALFGVGRGLAKREYDRFGVDMNESRDRFDEAAALIMRGLETGIVEGDGRFYKQMRAEVRPRPYASFKDRFYCVAMSASSLPACASLGARCLTFAMKPWDQMNPHFDAYRQLFYEYHNRPAPPPALVVCLSCDESGQRAEALAREHMANVYMSTMEHYDLAGDTFRNMKGYTEYADNAAMLRSLGMTDGANAFADVNLWGTPQQILDKIRYLRQQIGDFDLTVEVSYGGMSTENAEKSLRLFAAEVLPEIKSWKPNTPGA